MEPRAISSASTATEARALFHVCLSSAAEPSAVPIFGALRLIERGYFKDQQSALAAAVAALQLQMADETMSDQYYDEDAQRGMDALQLGTRA